jgi:hypothetical protein
MRRLPFAVCLLLSIGIVLAQVGRSSLSGTVAGTVLDPRGMALAEAPIQARNKATGALARTVSKDDGRYSFTNLAAGSYELSIVMPCCAFNTFREDITLAAGQTAQLNARLSETINGTTLGDDPGRLAAAMRKRAKVPSKPVPRTGGKPDLSGVWLDNGDAYPEQAEVLPWAAAVLKERADNLGKDHPHNHCLPGSPPIPGSSSPFIAKLVQTSGLLVILFEDVPGFRQIFLDGRSHPANLDPTWMGHSVGKWEGDTLVIDTTGFNDRSWIGFGQGRFPHTEMLRMTERYRRVDYGHMDVRVTFDDPATFVKPLHVNLKWDLAPQEELLEFVCENNKPEHLVGK